MTAQTYYIVRVKGTSHRALPAPRIGTRGSTWVEPTTDELPRLFKRSLDAQNALRWWKLGMVSRPYNHDDGEAGELQIDPQPNRTALEMEIVGVQLIFPEPTEDSHD